MLALLCSERAWAQPARPAYALWARLDAETHTVEGRAHITFESPAELETLRFHLYLNAFEGPETVFMRTSGGQLRGDRASGTGSIEVHELRVRVGGEPLETVLDDELVENDRSQLRATPERALRAGERVRIEVRFTSHLPPVFARSGYHRDFHMVAQWFPKLAHLGLDGRWTSFPYYAHGEFFANFGSYDLHVDVPQGFVVGATGTEVPALSEGEDPNTEGLSIPSLSTGFERHRFRADNVHDTAFVTAPWWIEKNDEVGSVQIRLLHPPGYETAAREHMHTTKDALAYFAERYGTYAYDQLTVVVPPSGAEGAAGMEYPTLFVTAGPSWRVPASAEAIFGSPLLFHAHVSAHELGHQWFQGMVASDEVTWPMLDEGITEWITADYLRARFGENSCGHLGALRIGVFECERVFAYRGRPTPPPGTPASGFAQGGYGAAVYGASTVIFETVARTWGRGRFSRMLAGYARAQRFRHPSPDALFAAADEEYGAWMSARVLRPALLHGARAVFRLQVWQTANGVRAEVRRFGGLPIPVRIAFDFEEGTSYVTMRDGVGRFETEEVPRSIRIDPDRHNLSAGDRRPEGWIRRDGFAPGDAPERAQLVAAPQDSSPRRDEAAPWAWLLALFQAVGP